MRRPLALLAVCAVLDACGSYTSDDPVSNLDGGPGDAGTTDGAGRPACGVVGTPCCSGVCQGGAECRETACSCPTGKTACGDSCVDLGLDPANCGRCGHDCVGGTCSTGVCAATTLVAGQGATRAIVVENGRIYLARQGVLPSKGGIYSLGVGDLAVTPHFEITAGNPGCYALATDGKRLYSICGTPRTLYSCDLPGCVSPPTAPNKVQTDLNGYSTLTVAADRATGKMYYGVGRLKDATPGGGIFSSDGLPVGAPNQPNPSVMVMANGSLYWLNSALSGPPEVGDVRRLTLTDNQETVIAPASGSYYTHLEGLAVDQANVYFGGQRVGDKTKWDIRYAPVGGGGSTATFTPDVGYVYALLADGENVYAAVDNRVIYCPRTAGCSTPPKVLAENEPLVTAMAMDDRSLYFTRNSGELRRIAKP